MSGAGGSQAGGKQPKSRYFFNLHSGQSRPDAEGMELPGIAQARSEAVRAFGEMLSHGDGGLWDGEALVMEVTDEAGELLLVLRFTIEPRI